MTMTDTRPARPGKPRFDRAPAADRAGKPNSPGFMAKRGPRKRGPAEAEPFVRRAIPDMDTPFTRMGIDPRVAIVMLSHETFLSKEATRQVDAVLAQTERAWLSALAAKDERADIICHYTSLHDDPEHINTFLDEAAAITAEEVRAAAARWLRPQARAVVAYRTSAGTEVAA